MPMNCLAFSECVIFLIQIHGQPPKIKTTYCCPDDYESVFLNGIYVCQCVKARAWGGCGPVMSASVFRTEILLPLAHPHSNLLLKPPLLYSGSLESIYLNQQTKKPSAILPIV